MNKKLLTAAVICVAFGANAARAAEDAKPVETKTTAEEVADCSMATKTVINVKPTSMPIQYDFNRGFAQIQGQATGTVDPHSFEGVSVTQGFMEGQIGMQPTVKMGYATIPALKVACVWYDTIEIPFKIEPKIVVAKEVAADKCMKPAVLEHEMKHIKVDRMIVNKYAQSIGQKVYAELSKRGFVAGPIPIEQAQATVQRMQETVGQIVDLEYKKMDIERVESQRAVDSLEEYNRVQALCPDFDPTGAKAASAATPPK